MQQKFLSLQSSLGSIFLEREEIIHTALAAMLAGEHVLLLGPPGSAKSQLARAISDSISKTSYFEWLLTKFSTPEEIFGPISLKALQEDRFERIISGKMPEANIVFIDEIFKASSAILNSLLSIINERVFHNNGTTLKVPLISLLGASNELPASEDLNALYDRFLVKFWVNYVSEANFRNLITLDEKSIKPALTLADLLEAQKQVQLVSISESTIDAIEQLRMSLSTEGFQISDRKWRQSLKLIKATAWLDNQQETTPEHLEVLRHVLWNDPSDKTKVARIVASISNPLGSALLDAEDNVREIFNNATKASTAEAGAEANQKLKEIQRELDVLLEKNPAQKLQINGLKAKVQKMNRKIIKEILGLEI